MRFVAELQGQGCHPESEASQREQGEGVRGLDGMVWVEEQEVAWVGEEPVSESICEWGLGEWLSVKRQTAPFPRLVARGSSDQHDACSKHKQIGREINAAKTQRLVLGFPSNEGPTVVTGLKGLSVKRGRILLFLLLTKSAPSHFTTCRMLPSSKPCRICVS